MSYCYCCIYGQMIEIGTYMCTHYNVGGDKKRADVSCCFYYVYDDQFDESEDYPKCYLKDICYEKNCERFI